MGRERWIVFLPHRQARDDKTEGSDKKKYPGLKEKDVCYLA